MAPNGEPKFWVANAEFARMLGNTKMAAAAPEDKPKIIELLKKPWNPYIQSALNA